MKNQCKQSPINIQLPTKNSCRTVTRVSSVATAQGNKNKSLQPAPIDGGFDGISGLLHATADDLKRVKGLGQAKRAKIVAVLELARRAMAQQLKERTVFADPDTIKHYLKLHLAARSYEVFAVIFGFPKSFTCHGGNV